MFMKRKMKQTFAMMLAAVLVIMQPLSVIYAAAEETAVCTCSIRCREGAVNESCMVCCHEGPEGHVDNIGACLGEEPLKPDPPNEEEFPSEPEAANGSETPNGSEISNEEELPSEPEEAACTCIIKCSNGAVNEECPICSHTHEGEPDKNIDACKGKDVKNIECICSVKCEEGFLDLNCILCSIFSDLCTAEPAAGDVCRCELQCTEGNTNDRCAVCSTGDLSACRGIVCTCETNCSKCIACINGAQCAGCTCILKCVDEINTECPKCASGAECRGSVCSCAYYQCTDELKAPFCPACSTFGPSVCKGTAELPPCTCQAPCKQELYGGPVYNCERCQYEGDVGKCKSPKCVCEIDGYVCTIGNRNPSCSVCQYDRASCRFTGCSCFIFSDSECTESNIMTSCKICSKDYRRCLYFPITSSALNQRIREVPDGYEFHFKTNRYSVTETITVDHVIGMCEDPYYHTEYKEVLLAPHPDLGDRPMIRIKDGGSLTIHDLILDGTKGIFSSEAPMIYVEKGGTLNLENGSVLRNSQNINGAAAIYVEEGGTLKLSDDAQILNNESAGGMGAVHCEDGTFVHISGNACIYGNKGNDLVLAGKTCIDISKGMGNSARIFVMKKEGGAFARKSAPPDNKDLRAFASSEGYNVIQRGCELYLSHEAKEYMTGRVLLDSCPVQNAKVTVKDKADSEILFFAVTDKEGSYKIPVLDSGIDYRVTITANIGGKPYGAVKDRKVVKDGDNLIFDEISLQKGKLVSGSVSGPESLNAQVLIMDMEGNTADEDTTYGLSSYDVILPSDGVYPAVVKNGAYSGSGFICLENGKEVSGEFMSIEKGILATGRILDMEGKPAEGAVITIVRQTEGRSGERNTPAATAVANLKGEYTIGGLEGGGTYEATAFSSQIKGHNTVNNLVIKNGQVMNGNENTIALKPAYSVKGTIYYIKTYFQTIFSNMYEPEYPRNIMLELSTENGVRIAIVPVNSEDGSFTLPVIYDGSFRAAIVSALDKNIRIDSVLPSFIVKEGKITCNAAENQFSVNEQECAALNKENAIRINHSSEFEAIWSIMLDASSWDMEEALEESKFILLSLAYDYFTKCNIIEKDMLIDEHVDRLNLLMQKAAEKYKITVSTNNEAHNIVRNLTTSLGSGEQVSETAKTLAGNIGGSNRLGENAQIDICLDVTETENADKVMLEDASLSGEIIQTFDMALQARYSEGGKSGGGKSGEQAITRLPGEIEIGVELEGFAYEAEQDYVVLRSHKNISTGETEISVLDTRYKDGKLYFNTDRFSSYAVAYASPDEGIVIEAASPDTPGVPDTPDDSVSPVEPGAPDNEGSGSNGGSPSPEIILPDDIDEKKDEDRDNRTSDKRRPNISNGKKDNNKEQGNTGTSSKKKTGSYTQKEQGEKNIDSSTSGEQITSSGNKKKNEDIISDKYDEQYMFWLSVYNQVNAAADGDTITVDAGAYTTVPYMVIKALQERDVTLVIKNDLGEAVIVNGLNVSGKGNVLYYSFDDLKEMENNPGSEKAADNTKDGGQGQDKGEEGRKESLPYPFENGASVIANAAEFENAEESSFNSRNITANRNISKLFMVMGVFGGTALFAFSFFRKRK